MTSVEQIKRMARSLRQGRDGHYYVEKYGDISVADLLLVLEDMNYHSEETIVEALVSLDFGAIAEAVNIADEHYKAGYLTDELGERRRELDRKLRDE